MNHNNSSVNLKYMRRFLFAIFLTIIFAFPAYANKCKSSPCVGIINGSINETAAELFIEAAKDEKDLVLIIDSPGGNVESARKMIQAMAEYNRRYTCIVAGTGASAAFWFLQRCEKRIALNNSILIAHNGFVSVPAGASIGVEELRSMANNLETWNRIMRKDISMRLNLSIPVLEKKFSEGDWVMTADEALVNNAIDKIYPSVDAFFKELERGPPNTILKQHK
jgi:ATP-dependent protease ClpP protease subunit